MAPGDDNDEAPDTRGDWLQKLSRCHLATKTGPIQVPLDFIDQAEFGPTGFASRALDKIYAQTIAESMWDQGILFTETVECYVPFDPKDFDIEKYSSPSTDNPPPKVMVFCGQHRTYALKTVKTWIEGNKPNGRVRAPQVEKVNVNLWVGLSQEDAIKMGKMHNDHTHDILLRDTWSNIQSLRARWMQHGQPQPKLKDGVIDPSDRNMTEVKNKCFESMNIIGVKQINKHRTPWVIAIFPERVFTKIFDLYKAYREHRVKGQKQKVEGAAKKSSQNVLTESADDPLLVETKGGRKSDTIPCRFWNTLLLLNTGSELDLSFAETQLQLAIDGQMSLKEVQDAICHYMKRKKLQIQLCYEVNLNRNQGWQEFCSRYLNCSVEESARKIKVLLDMLPPPNTNIKQKKDKKGKPLLAWHNEKGEAHPYILQFIEDLQRDEKILEKSEVNASSQTIIDNTKPLLINRDTIAAQDYEDPEAPQWDDNYKWDLRYQLFHGKLATLWDRIIQVGSPSLLCTFVTSVFGKVNSQNVLTVILIHFIHYSGAIYRRDFRHRLPDGQ